MKKTTPSKIKYCLAYGRNLDIKRMKERCPSCELIGKTFLKNWQIAFKKYITIEPKEGAITPVGIWKINEKAEKELDDIEHFPVLYRKDYTFIEVDGKLERALVYLINDKKDKYPDKLYLEKLLIGYHDFDFDKKYLKEAIDRIPKKKVFIIAKNCNENYVKGLQMVGVEADVGIKCKNTDDYDGLLIPGGGDMHPKWYKQKNLYSTNIDFEADKNVFKHIKKFIKKKKAILGICLGSQYLNVYFGGTLKQHIENHKNVEHKVSTDDQLFIKYFGKSFKINSLHHQAIDKLGKNLKICAVSNDGIIEAFVHVKYNILAVQWHPELILNKNGKKVFEIFKTML